MLVHKLHHFLRLAVFHVQRTPDDGIDQIIGVGHRHVGLVAEMDGFLHRLVTLDTSSARVERLSGLAPSVLASEGLVGARSVRAPHHATAPTSTAGADPVADDGGKGLARSVLATKSDLRDAGTHVHNDHVRLVHRGFEIHAGRGVVEEGRGGVGNWERGESLAGRGGGEFFGTTVSGGGGNSLGCC